MHFHLSWFFPIDHYAVLGLQWDASQDEVARAYAELQRMPPPTGLRRWLARLRGHTPQARRRAFRVLSNPRARAPYDERRRTIARVALTLPPF